MSLRFLRQICAADKWSHGALRDFDERTDLDAGDRARYRLCRPFLVARYPRAQEHYSIGIPSGCVPNNVDTIFDGFYPVLDDVGPI